jgi:hypothetical protein
MTSLQIEYVGYVCKNHHHTLATTMWQIQLNVFEDHSFLSTNQDTQMEKMEVFLLLKPHDRFENITSGSTTIVI